MKTQHDLAQLTDTQLAAELSRVVSAERTATSVVVATLAEFDARRLYLPKGYSSLFTYCLDELKLTEDATFNRVEAARAARKFPIILDLLALGDLSLTAARLLAPHLTHENHQKVLRDARHKTKREVERMVACLRPLPPVPSIVRKLPAPQAVEPTRLAGQADADEPLDIPLQVPSPAATAAAETSPVRRPVVAPLSEAHYKLQVTISTKAYERLREIQDLMRHRLPSGDPAAIVEHAFEVLHAELLKRKAAQVAAPRTGRMAVEAKGRHIPASVKRAVWRRDEGRCAFVGEGGKRCGATGVLEYHHVQPYAAGGPATVDNLQMRCRAHNGFEWERHLGEPPRTREGWAETARRVQAAGTHAVLDPPRSTRFDQHEWKW